MPLPRMRVLLDSSCGLALSERLPAGPSQARCGPLGSSTASSTEPERHCLAAVWNRPPWRATVATSSRNTHSSSKHAPIILVAISLGVIAVGYTSAAPSSSMLSTVASAYLIGAAITIWLATRLSGPTEQRVLFAILIGIGYAASLGGTVSTLAPFAIAITTVFSAVYWTVNTRRPHPAPEATAGLPASTLHFPARPD